MMARIAAKTNAYILGQAGICPRTQKALERKRRAAALAHFLEQIDRLLLDQGWAAKGYAIAVVLSEPIGKPGITNQVCLHYVGEV